MCNEELLRKKAEDVFQILCSAFDKQGIIYEKDEESLSVSVVSGGEDLPMGFRIEIVERIQTILLRSPIPIDVKPSKRLDMAVAVTRANHIILDGCFDYNLKEGIVSFRMTSSFLDIEVSEEEFLYMIRIAYSVVEDFNDRFDAVNNGKLEPERIYEGLM